MCEASDYDCLKVNAFRLARELGVPRSDGLRALLFATRLGLFDLNWDVHCPSCMAVPLYHHHLMQLDVRAHCSLCALDWEIDFEEQVEVTFTVNPDIRPVALTPFEARDEDGKISSIREMLTREQRPPVFATKLGPSEVRTFPVTLEAGEYICTIPGPIRNARLHVTGRPTDGQTLRIAVDADAAITMDRTTLQPGTVAVTLDYQLGRRWGFHIRRIDPPNNWVSAAHVTAQQDFRDLFSGEFLGPDCSFAVRSTTLMFTDIRGSTEMYERLGDAAALAQVREHFRVMTDVIRAHEGGIVKTIGDAVMASFPVNRNALVSACEIQQRFAKLEGPLKGMEVKIGLHRGPAIAVSDNRNVDFFGRTVNIAARVQGQARPRQVLVSAAVLDDPDARAFLETLDLNADRFEVKLKGVEQPVAVTSIEL